MKIFWFILSLIPVPFLFHFYEYGQHLKGNETRFLISTFILSMIIVGIFSKDTRIIIIIFINIITTIVSIILASMFISNDGDWFTVVGRDGAVIFIAIIYLIGQLIVRELARLSFKRKVREDRSH